MDVLIDNDAAVKLAQCGLLEDWLVTFGDDTTLRTNETFRPWLTKRVKKGRVQSEIETAIFQCRPEPVELSSDQIPILLQLIGPNLDEGECVLFAAATGSQTSIVVTGDKRAIAALAQSLDSAGFADTLSGKIVCVEQVVIQMIDQHSFQWVCDRMVAAIRLDWLSDTALTAAFGSMEDATETNVRSTLGAYIDDLRKSAGGLLWPG